MSEIFNYRYEKESAVISNLKKEIILPQIELKKASSGLGLKIKSQLGNHNILFNASKNTNFIYKISPDLNEEIKNKINELPTYGTRVKWLTENGYKLTHCKINSNIFRSSLELIDSKLPEIMSSIILSSYITGKNKLAELVENISVENPCNFDVETNPHFYSYKIKRVLTDAALGMKAGKIWTGTFNAKGGYIIVKKD